MSDDARTLASLRFFAVEDALLSAAHVPDLAAFIQRVARGEEHPRTTARRLALAGLRGHLDAVDDPRDFEIRALLTTHGALVRDVLTDRVAELVAELEHAREALAACGESAEQLQTTAEGV